MTVALVVSLKGRPVGRFALDKAQTRIGRSPDNEIQIDSLAVSRHHAVVERGTGGGLVVRDLGSNNGTYLNGARVEGDVPVKDGDALAIGGFDLVVQGESPPRPPKRLASGDAWDLPTVSVSSTARDHDALERSSTTCAYLRGESGPPRLIDKDLYQIGKDAACDLRLEGVFAARKMALVVRGHGGWKLVNVTVDGKRVERNGSPVPDQAWLQDGDRLLVGDLQLVFHEGVPATGPP